MPKAGQLKETLSPKMLARAYTDLGDNPSDPIHHAFARLIADGQAAYKAYGATHPAASRATCESQGAVWTAHPKIRALIALHGTGSRNLLLAMAPEAVKTVFELMTNGESERVRLQAADSILDRGGAPRTKELAVSRAQEMWDDSDALVIDITSE